ncbi:hypothetical protein [Saccharopolyspora elongata]|uniref:Uncharacterized protein n=1 Tax=Saccharopolyspora elongata TaxID=2530387 RepID=A0A4R4ZGD6_9PSEU|nr:hypothetical protein [Saccharopolyspora elongata]TDD55582.1 hypothetical protein E1288_03815 [Saccharopolyspora elongata]
MGLLPAEVPDIPEARSEIVPARLARKLAPLFGVPWENGPFGPRTWVSDYNKITLSEIARGAPLRARSRAAAASAAEPGSWAIVDRVAVTGPGGSLPNEIPNATLNRFGPDTKAAVVLTATNRLLDPVVRAVESGMGLLVAADGSELPARSRLAAWAALVLEAFRTQPALVAAAIRARTIQRELLVDWFLPLAGGSAELPLTRCEVGGPHVDGGAGTSSRPRDLELADRTARLLGADVPGEVVDRLLRELMAIGTRRSSSHLWLSERCPGQLVVEALVPPTEQVDRYVEQVGHLLAPGSGPGVLPRIPATAELAGLPVLARRAVLIGLLTVLRRVQFDAEERERTRAAIVPLLAEVAALATECLGAGDPLAVLARCRAADMTVHTMRHDRRNELGGAVEELMAQVERCIELAEEGVVDRGAAAEAISSANVEINVVRRTNAADPDAKLPAPAELDDWLRRTWTAYRRILQITRDWSGDPDSRLAVGHHLHNYASYLASHPDDESDLLAAVELFADTVIPARELYWKRTQSFLPLRQSLQVATRATTTLSRRAAEAGQHEKAAGWAERGYGWIRQALDDRETADLLARATEPAAHFCLLAVPALLAAVETGVAEAGEAERAGRLLAVAEGWVRRVTGGDVASYSHYELLADLRHRIDAIG